MTTTFTRNIFAAAIVCAVAATTTFDADADENCHIF
jgi:hypothetical protein